MIFFLIFSPSASSLLPSSSIDRVDFIPISAEMQAPPHHHITSLITHSTLEWVWVHRRATNLNLLFIWFFESWRYFWYFACSKYFELNFKFLQKFVKIVQTSENKLITLSVRSNLISLDLCEFNDSTKGNTDRMTGNWMFDLIRKTILDFR